MFLDHLWELGIAILFAYSWFKEAGNRGRAVVLPEETFVWILGRLKDVKLL